jgi:hypothetical protein
MTSALACPSKLPCVSVERLETNDDEDVEDSKNNSECNDRVALGHPFSDTKSPRKERLP